jgi:hypothetical protein
MSSQEQKDLPEQNCGDCACACHNSCSDIPEGEKPNLFDYLASLPDVEEDETPPSLAGEGAEPEAGEGSNAQAEETPENKLETLVEIIRFRAKAAHITPLALLKEEDLTDALEDLANNDAYKDIVCIKGDKDSYYYSNTIMTDSFANIAVRVEEKNDAMTLAHCVRERSAYPALTYSNFFDGYPFNFSPTQMEAIKSVIKTDPAYADIQVITLYCAEFFYSTLHIKPEIANYLADELINERP